MNSKYVAVVAVLAVMLVAATALMTTGNAFATYKSKSQAASQTNDCGNGELPVNIGCQNTVSQIQGDENVASLTSQQSFPGEEVIPIPPD
jgi:hypothetical protein